MQTPTTANTVRWTPRMTQRLGTAQRKSPEMGRKARKPNPPQPAVTSAARNVVLARRREPARLLRMYTAGKGAAQERAEAAVNNSPHSRARAGPVGTPRRAP